MSDQTLEAIYQAYPRHVGKAAALKAIATACKAADPVTVLEATKAYATAVRHVPKARRHFIPYPATWFNAGRHEDDPSEWVVFNDDGTDPEAEARWKQKMRESDAGTAD